MIFNEDYKSTRPQDYKLVGVGIKKEFLVTRNSFLLVDSLSCSLVVFIN
jgi:hypothetical protein